jgi:hypothetical protein
VCQKSRSTVVAPSRLLGRRNTRRHAGITAARAREKRGSARLAVSLLGVGTQCVRLDSLGVEFTVKYRLCGRCTFSSTTLVRPKGARRWHASQPKLPQARVDACRGDHSFSIGTF